MLRFTYKKVITVLYNMTYFFMFVTAVCILFLFKLKWRKNKGNVLPIHGTRHKAVIAMCDSGK